jgi:hypothetical protein
MSSENTQEINAQCPKCFALCNEKDVDYESKHCKGCKPKTATDRLAEELEKFENGAQRYDSQASFAAALNSLSHGLGVYAVLDSTLKRNDLLHRVNAELEKENRVLTERLRKYESI